MVGKAPVRCELLIPDLSYWMHYLHSQAKLPGILTQFPLRHFESHSLISIHWVLSGLSSKPSSHSHSKPCSTSMQTPLRHGLRCKSQNACSGISPTPRHKSLKSGESGDGQTSHWPLWLRLKAETGYFSVGWQQQDWRVIGVVKASSARHFRLWRPWTR